MTDARRPDWTGRLHNLQFALAAHEVDALVVSTPLNVTYLSGFDASAQMLVITPSQSFLITDGRYEFAASERLAQGTIAPVTLERVERRYDLTLGALLRRLGVRRAGFEPTHVTVATLDGWQRASATIAWTPLRDVVEKRRMVKDAGEIATLRRAARMLANVASGLDRIVAAGRSEREIATAIDAALVEEGFSRPAFATIVASGPNSALPHARPTDRLLTMGDLVVLDFGGVLDGYCVDLTRMAAVGSVTPEADALFTAVRAAHEAAVSAVRPGVPTSDVDAAARTVLEARGLGDAFLHSTGHGLGLEVHEAPRIARPDPEATELEVIAEGMVFTIEPGAYVQGVGGVRLEDDVLVTAKGCEVLTEGPRDLLVA